MTKEMEFLMMFANKAKEIFEEKINKQIFLTSYGMTDPDEDICEFTEGDNPNYIWNRT